MCRRPWPSFEPLRSSWLAPAARTRLTLLLGVLLLLVSDVLPALAQDSLRARVDVGAGYDLTNQIFYEQTFDSTAFTGRRLVKDPEARLVALSLATVAGARGLWSFEAANDLRGGRELVRDHARALLKRAFGNGWRADLDGDVEYRRDDTFGERREENRLGLLSSARYASGDLAWAARAFHRYDRQRSASGAARLVPDYDFQQIGFDADHFALARGDVSLSYAFGARSFPDTAARDYGEHRVSARGRLLVTDGAEVDGWLEAARRVADRDSAIGDRFWQSDLEGRLTLRRSEELELGIRSHLSLARYDEPTPAFFNSVLYRHAPFGRWRPSIEASLEVRPELELLRTPDFGGLPDTTASADLLIPVREEYDQWALRAEWERFGKRSWYTLSLGGGWRNYLSKAESETDVSGRSDFGFGEVSGFFDRRLTERLRVRLNGDYRFELHTIDSDDLQSLFLSSEVRIAL